MDKEDRAWKRLNDIAEADRSEYERLVRDNAELRQRLKTLQGRYGFPLSVPEFTRWMDRNREQFMTLQRELKTIMQELSIPDRWWSPVLYITGTYKPLGVAFDMGFPGMAANGDLIITTSTDFANPIVQDAILQMQRTAIEERDPIPKPHPMKNNKRKLDWRPISEWHKRHPNVTHDEIAKHLGYTPQRVRLKLAELDNDK